MKNLLVWVAVLAFSAGTTACSGGGGTTQTALPSIASATSAPTNAPTSSPTTAPTVAPTIAPTTAPALKTVGGAPLSATASQLSRVRTQAKTTAQGITNGVPILVESSGTVALWAGNFVNWVTNAADGKDVPQTSGTITTTNNLLLDNPGFSRACVGSLAPACIVHPTAWTFGTDDTGLIRPLGKQTLNIAFGDGTTAQTFDYIYNGWSMACNAGWAYSAGAIVQQATKAASDVYADCVAGNIVFPKGGILFSNPLQDQYGRTETIFPTITAAIFLSSLVVNVPMASIALGQVYGVTTQDGGVAKVYFNGASSTTTTSASGMSLHANPDGTYPY